MSTWTDKDESELIRLIKESNIQKEPTLEEYFGQAPQNIWRTEAVQQQQIPISQVGDPWTKEGQRKIREQKKLRLMELEQKGKKKPEWVKFFSKISKNFATPSQIAAVDALQKGDYGRTLYYLARASKEQIARTDAEDKRKIAKLQAKIEELNKQIEAKKAAHPSVPVKTKRPKKGKGAPRKPNAWNAHCKKVKAENPDMPFKDVMKKAKESYVKSK